MSNLVFKAQLTAMETLVELRRIELGREPKRTVSEAGQFDHEEWLQAEHEAANDQAERIDESLRDWDDDTITGAP